MMTKPTIHESLTNNFILKVLLPIFIVMVVGVFSMSMYMKRSLDRELDYHIDQLEYEIIHDMTETLDMTIQAFHQYILGRISYIELEAFVSISLESIDNLQAVYLVNELGRPEFPEVITDSELLHDFNDFDYVEMPTSVYYWSKVDHEENIDHYHIGYKIDEHNILLFQYRKTFIEELVERNRIEGEREIGILNQDLVYYMSSSGHLYDIDDYDEVLVSPLNEDVKALVKKVANTFYIVETKVIENHNMNVVTYTVLLKHYAPLFLLIIFALTLLAFITIMFSRYLNRHIRNIVASIDVLIKNVKGMTQNNQEWLLTPQPYDELDILVEQFNKMSLKIESSLLSSKKSALRLELMNHDLEAQVKIAKENEAQLTMILEHAYDGILLLNTEGEILRANNALWQLFGEVDIETTQSSHYKEFFDNGHVLYASCAYAIEGDSEETTLRTVEYQGRIIEELVVPILSEQHHQGYVMNYRDVTKRLELEAQVNHSTKMEAVGRLTSGIAHDFNNILQVIIGYADLIKVAITRDGEVKNLERKIKSIHDAAVKAEMLIRKLMTYSRLDQVTKESFDLNKCIEEIGDMLDRTLGDYIELKLALDRGIPKFYGDRTQMEQILVNLCINAKDAMDGHGSIKIETEIVEFEGEPNICMSVTDNGSGMTDEVKARIFEPFYTTKSVGDGTGLGLATVFGIVEGHGGSIEVDSVLDEGTSFHLHFPINTSLM